VRQGKGLTDGESEDKELEKKLCSVWDNSRSCCAPVSFSARKGGNEIRGAYETSNGGEDIKACLYTRTKGFNRKRGVSGSKRGTDTGEWNHYKISSKRRKVKEER